jgi:hypothetical protein
MPLNLYIIITHQSFDHSHQDTACKGHGKKRGKGTRNKNWKCHPESADDDSMSDNPSITQTSSDLDSEGSDVTAPKKKEWVTFIREELEASRRVGTIQPSNMKQDVTRWVKMAEIVRKVEDQWMRVVPNSQASLTHCGSDFLVSNCALIGFCRIRLAQQQICCALHSHKCHERGIWV